MWESVWNPGLVLPGLQRGLWGFDLWVFSSQRDTANWIMGTYEFSPSTPQGSKNLRLQVRFTWHGSFSEVGWPSPGSGWDEKRWNIKMSLGSTVQQAKLVGGLEHEFYFSYRHNNPNWPSYFSEGLKPPTRKIWFNMNKEKLSKWIMDTGTFKHGWKLGAPDAFVIAKGMWW